METNVIPESEYQEDPTRYVAPDDEIWNLKVLIEEIRDTLPSMSNDEKEVALRFLNKQSETLAREDFYTYVRMMAPLILPEGFKDGRHIKLMCSKLQQVEHSTAKGSKRRVQIFLPPGSMKSKLLNLFVSWCFGRHPKWNVLHIGHSTEFSRDNYGRPIRDLMLSPEYRRLFPDTEIHPQVRGAGRWETTDGGRYYATGVGTRIAGRRAHISICDDVVSEQTAYSDLERTGINRWYGPGLRTRLLPGASEIIVNTRWHLDDLSGYLLRVDEKAAVKWEVITVPALLDEKTLRFLDSVDPKWVEKDKNHKELRLGESFWPEMWPTKEFLEVKNSPTMPPSRWNALYMQSPTPEEGAIFKNRDFNWWPHKEPPPVSMILVSLDTAFSTKTRADYSAYTIWGIFKTQETDIEGREHWIPNAILLDAGRGRWELPQLASRCTQIHDIYELNEISYLFLIENKGSGISLIQELRRRGYNVMDHNPDKLGDKEVRAHACTPFFRNGRIWLPKDASWAREYIDELTQFPFGAHDDFVDATTQAILWLSKMRSLSHAEYVEELEDDEKDSKYYRRGRRTYWNAVDTRSIM